jgi:hypothetical protein
VGTSTLRRPPVQRVHEPTHNSPAAWSQLTSPSGLTRVQPCQRVAVSPTHPSLLAQLVILTVIPPGPTAANQTALNGMPCQPELPRHYWSGLSGRLAVISYLSFVGWVDGWDGGV